MYRYFKALNRSFPMLRNLRDEKTEKLRGPATIPILFTGIAYTGTEQNKKITTKFALRLQSRLCIQVYFRSDL
jgi:hypothetical protein